MYIISVDGIDGVGKSTYCEQIKNRNENSVVVHFPRYNTGIGKQIKKVLNNKEINNKVVQHLCLMDMINFKKDVDNGLYDMYDLLILDRSVISTLSYSQEHSIKDTALFIVRENGIIKPNESIIILAQDDDFSTIDERLSKKSRDNFENLEFLKNVNNSFSNMPLVYDEYFNFKIINMKEANCFDRVKCNA